MSKNNLELESLRSIFADNKTHLAVAKILRLSMVEDRSVLKCLVSVFPEQREVIARMTWEDAGPESGIFSFPETGDLVLVAFADGDDDTAFVIRRMTSREEKIPAQAANGNMVMKARPGKSAWVTSDTNIFLSAGDNAPAENLVLGQQLKTLLTQILADLSDLTAKLASHTHSGNLGYPTSPPVDAADFTAAGAKFDNLKSSPVGDEGILSQIAFTEKGT